jgi:hypothetical protein
MAANTSPIFPLTPVIANGQVSAANTNRDGTGTLVDILTGGADGTRVQRIIIKAVGVTTAGMVRLYIYDGSATRLWKEVEVTAVTPSASAKTFEKEIELFGELALHLPATYVLRASTHNAETFNVIAEGGNY